MKTFLAVCALAMAAGPVLADEPDGLILPPGFHASVVTDGIVGARHLAFAPNGNLYVSTGGGVGVKGTGIIALHLDSHHKADQTQTLGTVNGATGLRVYKGALYAASPTTIYRFPLSSALIPTAAPDVIIDGMPAAGSSTHSLAFDGRGNIYVSVDSVGNICTDPKASPDARPVGISPCPALVGRGGIWRFDASKTGQKFPADGEQWATGLRNMGAMDWSDEAGSLYGINHGRDATHTTFPDLVSEADDDALSDEMHRILKGAHLGWPYTYWDGVRNIRLTAPEYGGDNKTPAPAGYDAPVWAFTKRVAPVDMTFYRGSQFPSSYRGGAFVATHGINGPKIPGGHGGYDVIFVPLDRSGKAGPAMVFADGFAGPSLDDKYSGHAIYRPVGVAVAPDGSLYVSDSNKGRIWRITYGSK